MVPQRHEHAAVFARGPVDKSAYAAAGCDLPGALLTGDGSDALKRSARERGYRVLTKPIKPASLRAFLAAAHR